MRIVDTIIGFWRWVSVKWALLDIEAVLYATGVMLVDAVTHGSVMIRTPWRNTRACNPRAMQRAIAVLTGVLVVSVTLCVLLLVFMPLGSR